MPILRGRLGKVPSGPEARVRNFIVRTKSLVRSRTFMKMFSAPGSFFLGIFT